MFYSQFILAKKGPLGTIWIAAHLERKLRKNQVADTDIGVSVDSILFPEVPIALRLSSHLLLGVVRIYSRKVNYLFDDCSEALVKVRQAFRSTAVDLPPEESKAPYHSITLPETFDLDDFELPDTDIFQGNFVDHHVSSKEQITLQDTMDDVVYSTSQFGLDERFGDGGTSHIGLDLDEELFLEKGASSGHGAVLSSCSVDPQTATEPLSNLKDDVRNEDADNASGAAPANTIMQGPATPGLLEEPNLPIVQEAQVSEDHMEEDHLVVPVPKGGSDIAPEEFASTDVASVSVNNTKLLKDMNVDSFQDDSMFRSEPYGDVAIHAKRESGQTETITLNGTLAASHLSHKDDDKLPDKTSINDICASVSESISVIDKTSDHAQIFTSTEADKEIEHSNLEHGSLVQKTNELRAEDAEILNHDSTDVMKSSGMPLLQACSSCNDHANDKQTPGEVQEVLDPAMNNGALVTNSPCEAVDEVPSNMDGELENMIPEDAQKQKESSAMVSEFPSPEKLLSHPYVPIGQENEFLIGQIPQKEALAEGDQDISVKASGKKRSFTESTVTLQSLNSVESSEAAQSKRSVEFVPDDDDLLSSILVGRRSTALKIKSTPAASELITSKRQRVASRSGAHKRKALVDDYMVLHGDLIREQLVNTEDIRRVRKKAPSTRPEIWILQKQFLESEVFSEPLFPGFSTELVRLHSQPLDPSGIKIGQDEGGKSKSAAMDRTGSPSRITVGEHIDPDGTSMPSVARDGSDEQSLKVSVQPGAMITSAFNEDKVQTMSIDGESGNETSQIGKPEEETDLEIDKVALVGIEAVQPSTLEAHLSDGGTHEGLGEQSTIINIPPDTSIGDRDIVERRSEDQLTVRTEVDSALATTNSLINSSLPVQDENNVGATSLECGGLEPTSDHVLEEKNDHLGMVNEDEMHISAIGYQPEGLKPGSSVTVEGGLDHGNASLVEAVPLEADNQIPSDAATAGVSDYGALEQYGDFEADIGDHDIDFLNFDDEIAEEDDNSMANAEETGILDNSGWSTRTRAVANYLQTLFIKEAQHGRRALRLDSLLAGKSRKEASRMFFETLVLKTRDYIHAEQEGPLGSISVKPRVKLTKSEF